MPLQKPSGEASPAPLRSYAQGDELVPTIAPLATRDADRECDDGGISHRGAHLRPVGHGSRDQRVPGRRIEW